VLVPHPWCMRASLQVAARVHERVMRESNEWRRWWGRQSASSVVGAVHMTDLTRMTDLSHIARLTHRARLTNAMHLAHTKHLTLPPAPPSPLSLACAHGGDASAVWVSGAAAVGRAAGGGAGKEEEDKEEEPAISVAATAILPPSPPLPPALPCTAANKAATEGATEAGRQKEAWVELGRLLCLASPHHRLLLPMCHSRCMRSCRVTHGVCGHATRDR